MAAGPIPFSDFNMMPPSVYTTHQGGGGQNQFMSFPTMAPPGSNNQAGPPNFSFKSPSGISALTAPPGVVPPSSVPGTSGTQPLQFTGPPGASGITGAGKGLYTQNPIDPALTSQFFQFLQSMIGKGASPFNLSTLLPSSGEATQPGQLNAPLTQLLQEMQKIFGPSGQIGEIAAGGVDAVAPWQKMVEAMRRQIGQGAANLKEQFNVEGGLASSPFAQAATDYQLQSNKDLNSLLAQMQFQGIQDQLQAGGIIQGAGQFEQGLDQQAIQNVLQEFIRTRPEYSPLLGLQFGASTTFPPLVNPKAGAGGAGGLLSGLGSIFESIPGLMDIFKGLFSGGAGLAGFAGAF